MVGSHLTPELIKEGAILLEGLDKAGLPPRAAFWLFFPESDSWRLVLVDVKFTREGPRKAYRTILKILQGLRRQIAELQLEDVTVDTGDARVTALLSQARKSGSSMEGTRLTRNAFDGKLIEDVYIYRLRRAA